MPLTLSRPWNRLEGHTLLAGSDSLHTDEQWVIFYCSFLNFIVYSKFSMLGLNRICNQEKYKEYFYVLMRNVTEAVYLPVHQLEAGGRIRTVPDKGKAPPVGVKGPRAFDQEAEEIPWSTSWLSFSIKFWVDLLVSSRQEFPMSLWSSRTILAIQSSPFSGSSQEELPLGFII